MDIMSAFHSTYVKHGDLQGREIEVAISHVTVEEIDGGQKGPEKLPVLYFQGAEKGLVLNKTNATNISMVYGPNTDAWTGRRIVLYPAKTDFGGRTVDCIRVKGPANGAQTFQAPLGASAVPPTPPAPPPAPPAASPPPPPNGNTSPFDLNDSIPF